MAKIKDLNISPNQKLTVNCYHKKAEGDSDNSKTVTTLTGMYAMVRVLAEEFNIVEVGTNTDGLFIDATDY